MTWPASAPSRRPTPPPCRAGRAGAATGRSQQPQLPGAADGLLAGLSAQLGVDVARVGLDGVDRQEQLLADLALRERARQQAQDGELAVGQRVARRGGDRRWRLGREAPGARGGGAMTAAGAWGGGPRARGQRPSSARPSLPPGAAPSRPPTARRERACASSAAAASTSPAPRGASLPANPASAAASR